MTQFLNIYFNNNYLGNPDCIVTVSFKTTNLNWSGADKY